MTYTLNFSLNFERQNSYIVYNSNELDDKPILVSVPEIVKLTEMFIKAFEEVGIIDQPVTLKSSDKEKPENTKGNHQKDLPDSEFVKVPTTLNGLSGSGYICKLKELNKSTLSTFCNGLTDYFQMCCSQISIESFLSEETNLFISGISEVIELRNYLARYTTSKRKAYQNGYLFIMDL